MDFMIHSSQTGRWLQYIAGDEEKTKDCWTEYMSLAKKYENAYTALICSQKLSPTSKPHVVMFDGIRMWNLNLSKAW